MMNETQAIYQIDEAGTKLATCRGEELFAFVSRTTFLHLAQTEPPLAFTTLTDFRRGYRVKLNGQWYNAAIAVHPEAEYVNQVVEE